MVHLFKHLIVFATALVVSLLGYHVVVGSGSAGGPFSSETMERVVEGFSLAEGYELTDLELLERDLLRIEGKYVDKKRFDPNAMFQGALDRVQREFAEVMFAREPEGRRVHVSVGSYSSVIDLGAIEDFGDLHREIHRVARILDERLSSDVERPEVEYALVNGVLDTLDPHSLLMPPAAAKEMEVDNSGEFGGLGIEITMQEGRLTVKVPLEDTPAYRAGLKPQDHIVRIEGESTINIDLQDAVDKLRGPVGKPVNIMVMRKGFNSPRRFKIVRERIRLNPLEGELLEGGIGYIKIKSFSRYTARDMGAELVRFKRELGGDIRGLVLDMRMNPGGYLSQAVEVADKFLEDGVIVATVEGGTGDRSEQRATVSGTEADYPIAVLVNGQSASASEIVAGAIRNQGRGVIIGERTFGKGSVQHLYRHKDGSELKLTVAKYLTPGDQNIQSVGISPDIRLVPSFVAPPLKEDEPDPWNLEALPLVSLFARDDMRREASLDNNLGSAAEEDLEDAVYRVRYLRERPDPDDPRDPEPRDDWEVQFARQIVLTAPGSRRADMLKAAAPVVERFQNKENARLLKAFADVGIDWSETEADAAPQLAVSLDLGADGILTAGIPENIGMTVTNEGEGPVTQLSAITDSKNPWLDRREFHFGRLEPGESRTFYQRTWLHSGYATEQVPVKITLQSGGQTVHEQSESVRTAPRLMPRLAYTLKLVDDGSGDSKGNGNGLPERGETIELVLDVENRGEGITGEAFVRIKNRSGRALDLEQGSVELGEYLTLDGSECKEGTPGCRPRIKPGGRAEARLRFTLDLLPDDGDWNLDLLVGDAVAYDYGTVRRGGFTEFFQLEEKLVLSPGTELPNHPRQPPVVSVTRSPETLTTKEQAVISGVVEEDRGIRDVMIFHGEDKVFYRGGNDSTRTLPFSVERWMEPGANSFFVLARDKDGLTASRMISVWYDAEEPG